MNKFVVVLAALIAVALASSSYSVSESPSADPVINQQKGKAEQTFSDTCGDGCSWSLDTSTGILTISGTGGMKYLGWLNHRNYLKSVTIGEGITFIAKNAFAKSSSTSIVHTSIFFCLIFDVKIK